MLDTLYGPIKTTPSNSGHHAPHVIIEEMPDITIDDLPAANLGQQPVAASLSVAPASNIADATYIGDIKFGEALPAGTANIGDVDIASLPPVAIASLPAANLGQRASAASLSITPATDLSMVLTVTPAITHAAISAAVFTGTGLDDATKGGTYSGAASCTFTVVIDGIAGPDTFKWQKDAGAWTEGVAITGIAQNLSDGVTITFAATTGHTATDQWVITVTVPYTAGAVLGGKTELPLSGFIPTGGTAKLQTVHATDPSAENVQIDLVFFDSNPTLATIADRTAPTFGADASKIVGIFSILSTDWKTIGGTGLVSLSAMAQQLAAAAGTSLWVVPTTPDTPSFDLSSALTIRLGFER